jgi:PrgI family protein
VTTPVRIPADVDRADRVIGPLTARQLTILTVTGLVLYAGWTLTHTVLPAPVLLTVAIPLGATATILALGQRDGLSLDRMLLAAIRQRMGPRHRVAAPEGLRPAPRWLTAHATTTPGDTPHTARAPAALHLPAAGITEAGVIDLGAEGLAIVAVASTVNFALRTPTEQESLVASFGRYLHSLTAPIQLLVRTERLDLSTQITELHQQAGGLPHPALEAAAIEHADYLAHLGEHTDLLRRQVLLVLREDLQPAGSAIELTGPSPGMMLRFMVGKHRATTHRDPDEVTARRAAQSRLVRRLSEAVELLAPAGIVLTPLDAGQTTTVLASACNPDTLLKPSTALAGANDIITSPSGQQSDPYPGDWCRNDDDDTDTDTDTDTEDWDYNTETDEFDDRGRD